MAAKPNMANAGRLLAVAGATDPSTNVVATGSPGSMAVLSPTWDGTVTPAAESTQAFMLVIVACATESRCTESAAATICGEGAGGRAGATYVVIWALNWLALSTKPTPTKTVRNILQLPSDDALKRGQFVGHK